MSTQWRAPDVPLTPAQKAQVAIMRFGLGPRPETLDRIASTPTSAYDACMAELDNPVAARISDAEVVVATQGGTLCPLTLQNCGLIGRTLLQADALKAEKQARYEMHVAAEVGFLERLALFWNNHFSVFSGKNVFVAAMVGHMERSVIRRHVLGRFEDMLIGVISHPAMICFLDNQTSCGPNSQFAKAQKRTGITYNENLAREILELHTLGVGAGYGQSDVIAFAKILTGWKVVDGNSPSTGQFTFDPAWHEPGSFTVMGQTFPQQPNGEDRVRAVLRMLARHPRTAEHLATKLLRHFVSDSPSAEAVDYLANVFRNSGGNLLLVSKALLSLPEAWTQPLNRLRQPYPWLVSVIRGLGVSSQQAADNASRYEVLLHHLGQSLWQRLTPDGYPDENYNWENSNAIRLRKDVVSVLVSTAFTAGRWTGPKAPDLARSLLGSSLSDEAAAEVARLPNDYRSALSLLFSTPEYLRW